MQLNTETSNELFNHTFFNSLVVGNLGSDSLYLLFFPMRNWGKDREGCKRVTQRRQTHHSFLDFLRLSLSWLVAEPEDTLFSEVETGILTKIFSN